MELSKRLKDEIARKLIKCLRDAGIRAEMETSERDSVVHGTLDRDGQSLRVVAHLTDREEQPVPRGGGLALTASQFKNIAVIRPTLNMRSAARNAASKRREPSAK
ncbi:MAG: hypothetical protein H7144_10975 [Burkholderiales bacterium]|nr:hypothetical protein [Phycisphaerae bacterium]